MPDLTWAHQPDTPGDWRAAQIAPGWSAAARWAFAWHVIIIGETEHGPYPFAESGDLSSLAAARDWTGRYLAGEAVAMRCRKYGPPSLTWAEARKAALNA